ncbi:MULTISPECIES: Rpn family recombination-promoting nuclease/putative transposase [Candidatus Hamiltonella]|uniref:Rpn family recombination-promoting nuclease/putative transposase n=1 Tax=Candidatus Williamhamiltonella TaxID=568987 RepID=UPI001F2CFDC4|nr:Rpn family recombination-promoting nuclease/putative transposase [Candidatus Hamiltonella defensa]
MESGSFVDEDMKAYQNDILYSLKTKKGKGYLYILIESVRRESRFDYCLNSVEGARRTVSPVLAY